jgi:hypothetical protein
MSELAEQVLGPIQILDCIFNLSVNDCLFSTHYEKSCLQKPYYFATKAQNLFK